MLDLKDYPEHAKLGKRDCEHRAVVDFLAFLIEHDRVEFSSHVSHAELIGDFFGIDPVEFEAEKQRMIEAIRQAG